MQNISCPNHQYSPPTCLPPGFRFHPTDEELITYYLAKKVADESFRDHAITEVDLNKHEPWDLPEKAKMMGEKEWYFFSHKDRKYPSGSRTNRATEAGYWKATGKDKEIFMKSTASTTARCSMSNGARKQLVGMKKTLVFYEGRAPRGLKSNWVMHEYRVHERASIASILGYGLAKLNQGRKEWVLCRVIHKKLRLSKRDDQYMKRDDTILNDAELLARFLLADDQQLSQLPPDQATPPLNIAGLDNLAAGPARSSLTVHSTGSSSSSDQLLPSLYSPAAHDCYSSLTNHNAVGAGLPSYSRASSYSAPLPRLPSDLESFWLQASPFLS